MAKHMETLLSCCSAKRRHKGCPNALQHWIKQGRRIKKREAYTSLKPYVQKTVDVLTSNLLGDKTAIKLISISHFLASFPQEVENLYRPK